MKNVQGSSAGAGSGEFHVYKQNRRREYERLKLMDEKAQKVGRCALSLRSRVRVQEGRDGETSRSGATLDHPHSLALGPLAGAIKVQTFRDLWHLRMRLRTNFPIRPAALPFRRVLAQKNALASFSSCRLSPPET